MAACPANYNINKLVAGTPHPRLRFCSFHCRRRILRHFPRLYLQLPDAARHCPRTSPWYSPAYPAVQDFSINYLSANNFAVYPSSISESQVAFKFDFSSPVWSKLRLNFWASNNQQIQLGYIKVGMNHPMQTTSRPSDHATAHSHTPTSTPPSTKRIVPSSEHSSTALMFLPIPFKFLSAPPISKEPNSPSRSPSVLQLALEGSGFPGWPSPPPLLPSAHMEDSSRRASTPDR